MCVCVCPDFLTDRPKQSDQGMDLSSSFGDSFSTERSKLLDFLCDYSNSLGV